MLGWCGQGHTRRPPRQPGPVFLQRAPRCVPGSALLA